MKTSIRLRATVVSVAVACALCASVVFAEGEDPVVQSSKQSQALASLAPKPLEQRVPVTIYEFHSGVPDVSVAAATDIFTTTLIESHQFRVVERRPPAMRHNTSCAVRATSSKAPSPKPIPVRINTRAGSTLAD
jgi:hypothetical protein